MNRAGLISWIKNLPKLIKICGQLMSGKHGILLLWDTPQEETVSVHYYFINSPESESVSVCAHWAYSQLAGNRILSEAKSILSDEQE